MATKPTTLQPIAGLPALRRYQWLILVVCTLGALLAAGPRIISQPVRYTAQATVQLDAARRYRELYAADGQPDADFRAVEQMTLELLRARHPQLGGPTYSVAFVARPGGAVQVESIGRTVLEAQLLADESAEILARSVRSAGGREILRNLMGWELTESLAGHPPQTEFGALLREMIRTSAFPLNRAVEPVSDRRTADGLPAEELSDLTRALEVREEQIALIDLPQLGARRNAASEPAALAAALADIKRTGDGQRAVRAALGYLYQQRGAQFSPDASSDAYRSARAAAPSAPVDRRIPLLLALTLVVGLGAGAAAVALDRATGAAKKARELWGYRALIGNLVLRDLRVRYKGSALGYLWTQLAPLMMMLVFWFVFSVFQPNGLAMFPIFLICGLLPWNFCAEAVNGGARSIIDNAGLIRKVYFPREVLPLVSVASSLINFLLSLPMLLLVMVVVQALYPPLRELGRFSNLSWTVLYLPVLIVIQTLFLAGVALALSAASVFFRDLTHLIGILIQFWFFLTPVVYPLDQVGAAAQVVRWLNPMASLVEFYREILYGNIVGAGQIPTPGLPALDSVLRVLLTAIVTLAVGYWLFQRRSGEFGERL